MEILKTNKEKNERFLRKPTPEVNLDKEDKKELRELIKNMRQTMNEAEGVGLSANQVGVSKRIFVAQIPDQNGKSKFYSIINPKIVDESEETITMIEGCLSIPGKHGPVERPKEVTLEGENLEGKSVKIEAWGLLARVFQHEVDHLNGTLFVDKAIEVRSKEDIKKPEKSTS